MLHQVLSNYIISLDEKSISEDRKAVLQKIANYVIDKQSNKQPVSLNFICTHNSRRSQLAQIWAQTLAYYAGVRMNSYSGGVEVTAFHPNAVKALKNVGFQISGDASSNPNYTVCYAEEQSPLLAFSKLYDHQDNPKQDFAAIMTCSDADDNCPYIPGAEANMPLRYQDPKIYDGSDNETLAYEQTSETIATEMKYLFILVKIA